MYFLAEFYLRASASLPDIVAQAKAGAAAASAAGEPVRFVQAVFVPPDETCFALYEAAAAAAVSAAGSAAGLEFDRITAAVAVL
jgi:Protein of unknown function (DUF4242)